MTAKDPKDNLYKVITNVLLTIIAVFGVFSLTLLISMNNKLNTVQKEQAVQKSDIIHHESRITKLEDNVERYQRIRSN